MNEAGTAKKMIEDTFGTSQRSIRPKRKKMRNLKCGEVTKLFYNPLTDDLSIPGVTRATRYVNTHCSS